MGLKKRILKFGMIVMCVFASLTIASAQLQWVPSEEVGSADVIKFSNNESAQVCKCLHRGNTYPGKVVEGKCKISWNGITVEKSKYEVLLKSSSMEFSWDALKGNGLPAGAVVGGRENEKFLYVGKAMLEDGTIVAGKIFKRTSGYVCEYVMGGKVISTNKDLYILTANHIRK